MILCILPFNAPFYEKYPFSFVSLLLHFLFSSTWKHSMCRNVIHGFVLFIYVKIFGFCHLMDWVNTTNLVFFFTFSLSISFVRGKKCVWLIWYLPFAIGFCYFFFSLKKQLSETWSEKTFWIIITLERMKHIMLSSSTLIISITMHDFIFLLLLSLCISFFLLLLTDRARKTSVIQ